MKLTGSHYQHNNACDGINILKREGNKKYAKQEKTMHAQIDSAIQGNVKQNMQIKITT